MKPEPMTDEKIEDVMRELEMGSINAIDFRFERGTAITASEEAAYTSDMTFARAIEAAVNAKWQAMLAAPHEAKTDAEKTAYAFGWYKGQESVRATQKGPDMRAVCEALGFDPTNHHNASKCLYCRPPEAQPAPQKEMELCEVIAKQSVEIDQLRSTIETYKEVKEYLDLATGADQLNKIAAGAAP